MISGLIFTVIGLLGILLIMITYRKGWHRHCQTCFFNAIVCTLAVSLVFCFGVAIMLTT